MKSFQFLSALSLSLALSAATPFTKRQAVSCPSNFRNTVFNTGMPGQGDVGNRWNTISSRGVSNWIGFTIKPLSQSPTYGNPATSPAFDSAQIKVAMDPRDVGAAKALITGPNPPTYLELFNEPDFSFMGFTPMTNAKDAAGSLQELINTPTSTQFISPVVAFTGSSYMSDFFNNCAGCLDKIPIIALHVYKPDPQQAIDQIVSVHNAYPSKKLWITELAPVSDGSQGCSLDENGVISWMQTVVKWAAASGYVDKIFWNCGEWGPIHKDNPGLCNPSLTNPDGSATALLDAYSQICSGSAPVKAPVKAPNSSQTSSTSSPTSSPTSSSTSAPTSSSTSSPAPASTSSPDTAPASAPVLDPGLGTQGRNTTVPAKKAQHRQKRC